ncbi:Uncharacterised protein [Anaerobiospirillum thomasii]|uniref:Uncharacterized protein n=1 Tax=Anaerobiospirillum thomasii TaxID=179995 RepID=A0A2X0VTA5_9GAMM|nr:Uncharacterised protein [Anaerobiospirillum thomasii]SPT70940.1 Uncharacterised protein [Anaerobiospirillum thomasii]
MLLFEQATADVVQNSAAVALIKSNSIRNPPNFN